MSRQTRHSLSIRFALAAFLCGYWNSALAEAPDSETEDSIEARGDSLFRLGNYQAALDAYTRSRWKDTADGELHFKHFLACEFRGGDCRKEERLDFYYSEKAASPFLGVMQRYRLDRLEISSLGSGNWSVMRSDQWVSPAAFFELTGHEDLAGRARLRERAGLGLLVLGTAAALAAIGYWVVEGEDCQSPRDETGCRNLQTGSTVLSVAGIALGYGGFRMRSGRVVPESRAKEMAHAFNTKHLKRMIVDLPVFRRLETGLRDPELP